ncbi:putative tripeptidyl-peptidase II [Helianthus debilis subsp. tardiflorus]
MKNPITTNSGSLATPYDLGAGEVSLNPLHPGLVYETDIHNYLHFLCNIGYNITTIKKISSTIPTNFTCHTNSSVSNMNYPSIAISKFNGTEIIIKRTVTNVGTVDGIYTASVEAPNGLEVNVVPNMLEFTESKKQLSYQVIFRADDGFDEDKFGSIIWSNDEYRVRSPFVVSSR